MQNAEDAKDLQRAAVFAKWARMYGMDEAQRMAALFSSEEEARELRMALEDEIDILCYKA